MSFLFFLVVLISIGLWVGPCVADNPENRCIKQFAKTNPACIVHCKYNLYKFTDDNYDITDQHINKFTDILIKNKAVDGSKKSQVQEHLKKCAEESLKKTHGKNCQRLVEYYSCAVDNKLIDYFKYESAINSYDRTIYTPPYSG
nr:hypothetical protein [Lutzomyia ayacuchensis]